MFLISHMYRKKSANILNQFFFFIILHHCCIFYTRLIDVDYLQSAIHLHSHIPYSHIDQNISPFSRAHHWVSLWFVPLRLIVRSGNSSLSSPLFDSDLDDVPERGLLSEGSTLYLELTADSSSIPLLLALRYEGEQRDFRCCGLFNTQQNTKAAASLHVPLTSLLYNIQYHCCLQTSLTWFIIELPETTSYETSKASGVTSHSLQFILIFKKKLFLDIF